MTIILTISQSFVPNAINKTNVHQSEEGILYLILDVETTGLKYESSHIIQLAAKELGDEDLFSGMFVKFLHFTLLLQRVH